MNCVYICKTRRSYFDSRRRISLGDSPSFILLCYRQNAGFVHKSVDVGTKYVHENVANKVKFAHKSVGASCGVR